MNKKEERLKRGLLLAANYSYQDVANKFAHKMGGSCTREFVRLSVGGHRKSKMAKEIKSFVEKKIKKTKDDIISGVI